MQQTAEDKAREERIDDIIADANDIDELMMGWFYYLDDSITFPFEAECIEQKQISPLRKGENVTVLELVSEEDAGDDLFVIIEWSGRKMGVPLTQLKPLKTDKETKQAVEDWQYWKAKGYQF